MLWLRCVALQTHGLQVKFKVIIHYHFSETWDSKKNIRRKQARHNLKIKLSGEMHAILKQAFLFCFYWFKWLQEVKAQSYEKNLLCSSKSSVDFLFHRKVNHPCNAISLTILWLLAVTQNDCLTSPLVSLLRLHQLSPVSFIMCSLLTFYRVSW